MTRSPTGTIELFEGTTSLGSTTLPLSGEAPIQLAARSLPPGSHTLRSVYSGDDVYSGAEDTLTVTVTATPTTVKAPDTTATYGNPVRMKVTINAPTGNTYAGTITVSEGGSTLATAPVSAKVTTVTLPAGLAVGAHSLDVAYSGGGTLAAGSTTSQVTIIKASSVITAKVTPGKPRVGQNATLNTTVKGRDGNPATGDIRVTVDGGAPTVVTLTDGAATVDLGSFATSGGHTVTVEYPGSDVLLPVTRVVNVNVRA